MRFFKPDLAKVLLPSHNRGKTAALILAAGNSTRMGGKTSKQFMEIYDVPVLAYTLSAYQHATCISEIIVAARPQEFDMIRDIRDTYGITKLRVVVAGGKTRLESAKRAFAKIGKGVNFVAVADGARCLIRTEDIEAVCNEAYRHNAASAACRVVGTMKRTTSRGAVTETVSRENLWEAQTPQVFHVSLYAAALAKAEKDKLDATDDNAMVEKLGHKVRLVQCSKENIKITTPEDLRLAAAILAARVSAEDDQ